MNPVGVFPRAVAILIDMVLLFIVAYAISIPTGGTSATGFDLQGGPAFAWFLFALAYYVFFEGRFGASPGKMVMGLRVVRLEGGGAIDWKSAIIRSILRIVDGFGFYLVAAIAVWLTKNRQRVGDLAAGTIVVRKGA